MGGPSRQRHGGETVISRRRGLRLEPSSALFARGLNGASLIALHAHERERGWGLGRGGAGVEDEIVRCRGDAL